MRKIFFTIAVLLTGQVTYAQLNEPKLVVGIVVDQMAYEYLYRFQNHYVEGGLKRMMYQGTNARNMHYNYVPTYTGPGHASIYTGTTPSNHGIVGNDWYDYKTNKELNCVFDEQAKTVGSTSDKGNFAPTRLKVTTMTDQLKLTKPGSKVISMSIKNRGAILPGGHLSDGTFWFDDTNGNFISSTFFMEELPKWVVDFNNQKRADRYAKSEWNTLKSIENYKESIADNVPYEHLLGTSKNPVFPYNLKKVSNKEDQYEVLVATPYGNQLLNDFAIDALKNTDLGKDNITDFLAISFSSTDLIGHLFGPQSKEIQDTYLRLDLEIERLLNTLDKEVGVGEYIIYLTADHAVVPVPQFLKDQKLPGGYVFLKEPTQKINDKLKSKYGKELIIHSTNLNFYYDRKYINDNHLDISEIDALVLAELLQIEGVKAAFTRQQLMYGCGDNWFDMVQAGFNAKESGDILFVLESGYLPKSSPNSNTGKGTSHGSPFAYDTHVPFLIYGKGIPKQEIVRKTYIVDIAPSIAHLINISYSHATTGNTIIELFK